MDQSRREADTLLAAHGWRPIPKAIWGGLFTAGTLVGGVAPSGSQYVKDWAAIPPGHELYSADTPDTPHEAAEWLILHAGGASDDGSSLESHAAASNEASFQSEPEAVDLGADILDAEFESAAHNLALPPPECPLNAPAATYEPGAFIFGDDLEQRRSQRMGDVYRIALALMPEGIDYAKLAELRNFAMGVSEGRWSDNAQTRIDLDHMESIVRRANEIAAVRDAKISDLLAADRAGVEDYDVALGWPA